MSGGPRRLLLLPLLAASLIVALPISSAAAHLPPPEPASPVAAGGAHTCAIDAAGALTCWGDDSAGQVGGAPDGTFAAISAGSRRSCAIDGAGALSCWGDDFAGRIEQVPTGEFRAVSAGGGHACAIRTTGELSCWGDDSAGQVGEKPDGEFRSVSAGGAHTCAVAEWGKLTCWGEDSAGQVSDAPRSEVHYHFHWGHWHIHRHWIKYLSVDSGGATSCAIRTTGALACWGDDASGQVAGRPDGEFRSVAVGDAHACAIRTTGELACWGDDSHGQVSEAPEGAFSAVSSGGGHSCAASTGGEVTCWGDNSHGQVQPLLDQVEPPRAVIGSAYSYRLTATAQSPGPSFEVTAGSLPPGLTLAGDGEISGTPTTAGDFAFTVTANGVSADDSQETSLKVVGSPALAGGSAQGVTSSTASLSATINPRNLPASAWFEYWPAAAPQSVTLTPAKAIASGVAQKTVSTQIAGLQPDTLYAFRVAATNELGPNAVKGAVMPVKTEPGPGIPPPVAGQSVNVEASAGTVKVRCPGEDGFRVLSAAAQIPVGCQLDTDSGTVALTASKGSSGLTQSAYFWGGTFQINQTSGDEQDAVATLAGRLRCEKRAGAGASRRSYKRGRRGGRKLWGSGSGNFKTVGNYGSASVRGTTWLVIDRCDLSSVFEVAEGRVRVRDFIKKIWVNIFPGKRYVAKAPFLRLR